MAEQITLSSIIGLIIGVILTLAILVFAVGIMEWLKPVADEGSINNFNVLNAKIKSLIEDTQSFSCNLDKQAGGHTFYLMDGVILVGYNYNEEKQQTACSNEFATKPREYAGKAVLCLHTEDYANNFDEDPQAPIQCYSFNEKVIFLAPSDDSYYGGFGGFVSKKTHPLSKGSYEDLFLYGSECDAGTPDLGATKLYLDVYKDGEEVYVYINENNPDNPGQADKNKDRCEVLKKKIIPEV